MGRWKECKNCGNENAEDNIYICKEDNFVFCQDCGGFTPNIHGNVNCICPVCDTSSDVEKLGEIDPGADDDNDKCENCGNVDSGDMLYKCKEDDLIFCDQCGDYTPNIHGNNNCICPVCHSTSDVKVLGEIENDDDDEDDENSDNDRDDDDNDNSSNSSSSSGGCFITTACVAFKGLDDNCYELNVLRKFRDTYVITLPKGKLDLDRYRQISPSIISKINSRSDFFEIWNSLYKKIWFSIQLIEKKGIP